MPIFDFTVANAKPQVREPGFWIYWTVTIPLTIFVLCIYLAYIVWAKRKQKQEDEDAQKIVHE
jgi:hypothetical protein